MSLTTDGSFSYQNGVTRRREGRRSAYTRSPEQASSPAGELRRQRHLAVMAAALTSFSFGLYVTAPAKAITASESKSVSVAISATDTAASDRNAALSAQIISYRSLTDDWDGDGGVVPSEQIIEAALSFIDLLPLDAEPNEAMVEGSGEVGFYWNTDKSYIDVTFDGREIIYYAKVMNPIDGASYVARGSEDFDGRFMPSNLLTAISMA